MAGRRNEIHDWKEMMKYEHDDDPHIYDDIDMHHTYSVGFWIGAISGVLLTIGLCLLAGLYYNGWQLPG